MSLIDAVQSHLDANTVGSISQHLGIDPALAQRAIAVATPMIVTGMAQHASTSSDGATAVQQAAAQHRDVVEDVGRVVQAGPPADNTGLLGRILGQHSGSVEQTVQQATGLDGEKVRQLLLMLAPVVLGAFARRHMSARESDQGQVTGALQHEAQSARSQVQQWIPELGGLLGGLFGNR